MQFYDEMAALLRSGLTVERGLALMVQGKTGTLLWMLDTIQEHVMRGGTFADGLALYPRVFDAFQVMCIKAAEESGTLVESCQSLSRYFAMRQQEKRRLRASLIYPLVLLHGIVLLPPLKYLFLDNLGRSYWSVVLPTLLVAYGLVGIAVVCWQRFCQKGALRETIDRFLLNLPIIGKLQRGLAMARVLRALSGLHNAGIPPYMATKMAIQTAGNTAITFHLQNALAVLENNGNYTGFFSFSGMLPPMLLGVIQIGEETGTIGDSFHRLCILLEEESSNQLTTTIKAVGYLVYFIAAAFVAYTVISFYSGYFKVI